MRRKILSMLCLFLFTVTVLGVFNSAVADGAGQSASAWKTLQPARKLWKQRQYKAAYQKLVEIDRENQLGGLRIDVSVIKNLLTRVQDVVDEGYSALKTKVGHTYPVPLKGGGNLQGEVKSVSEEEIVLDTHGNEQRIDLDQIDIERIIRLSVLEYSPDIAKHQAIFAVLYAMENKPDKAQEALNRATGSGYAAEEEKSFVEWIKHSQDLEQREKERAEEKTAHEDQTFNSGAQDKTRHKEEEQSGKQVTVLVDVIHGENIPSAIRRGLQKHNVKIKYVTKGKFNEKTFKDASVLFVLENSASDVIKKEEAKTLGQFISSGGGLVYIGTNREKDPALGPFFKRLKVNVFPDDLDVDWEAPKDMPRDKAVALPTGKHSITRNLGPILFQRRTYTFNTKRNRAILISNKWVESDKTKQSPVVLGVAFHVGKGSVVGLGSMPELFHPKTQESARRLVLNAIAWANQ